MFRVMTGLRSVEWGMEKEMEYETDFQVPSEQTSYHKPKQKTLLDYLSN